MSETRTITAPNAVLAWRQLELQETTTEGWERIGSSPRDPEVPGASVDYYFEQRWTHTTMPMKKGDKE